jgi:hypothetical protein
MSKPAGQKRAPPALGRWREPLMSCPGCGRFARHLVPATTFSPSFFICKVQRVKGLEQRDAAQP